MESIGLKSKYHNSGLFRKLVFGLEFIIVLLVVLGILFQNSNQKRIEVDFSEFQSDPISSTLENMLSTIQFPWRYLGVANIFLALLLGETVEYFIAQGVNASKLYYVDGAGTFLAACLFISSFSEGMSQQRYIDAAELHQYPE